MIAYLTYPVQPAGAFWEPNIPVWKVSGATCQEKKGNIGLISSRWGDVLTTGQIGIALDPRGVFGSIFDIHLLISDNGTVSKVQ